MSRLEPTVGVLCLMLLACQTAMIAQNSAEPAQILLQMSKAFAGSRTLTSATLTGEVHRIAGSLNENGTITLTANADGSFTTEWGLSSGTILESRTSGTTGAASCARSGSDGVQIPTPRHNCAVPATWFLPAVTILSGVETGAGAFTVPQSSEPGELSLHWSATPTIPNLESPNATLAIGDFDLGIDATTMLPHSLRYSLHPDLNAGIDIPVTIDYSDYREINGVAIPFHIQRFLNGVLSADITLTDAVAN